MASEIKPIFYPQPREREEGKGHVIDQKRPTLAGQQQWRRTEEHRGMAMPVGSMIDDAVPRYVTERFSHNMKQDSVLSSSSLT